MALSDSQKKQINNAVQMHVNARRANQRQLTGSLAAELNSKHPTCWADYGYPENIDFDDLYAMYKRFGPAKSAVKKLLDKVWQTRPSLIESDDDHKQTEWEAKAAAFIEKFKLWRILYGADLRNRVGQYSGVIIIVKDSKRLEQPIGKVTIEQVVEFKPAWEGQLKPVQWVTDTTQPDYGKPTKYQYDENAIGQTSVDNAQQGRNVVIDASRVFIWTDADDGTIYGDSVLESCFNDLLDLQKVSGGGSEGAWKASRGSLQLVAESGFNTSELAAQFGVSTDEVADALSDELKQFVMGFDKSIVLNKMEAKPIPITIPDVTKSADISKANIASAVSTPLTIMFGQQTGRLASDEDQKDFAYTATSSRDNFQKAQIIDFFQWLGNIVNIDLKDDFFVSWDDLLEPSQSDKLGNGKLMADINKQLVGTGITAPFSNEQIAETSGFEYSNPDVDLPGDNDDKLDD